jgi:hypothetical protein
MFRLKKMGSGSSQPAKGTISTQEFCELIKDLALSADYNVLIRVRLLGEMWHTHFSIIEQSTPYSMILRDEITGYSTLVADLRQVIQFELDSSFRQYQPNFHYSVAPERG